MAWLSRSSVEIMAEAGPQERVAAVGVGADAACRPVGDECCVVPCGHGSICDWISRSGGQGLGHKHVSTTLCDGPGRGVGAWLQRLGRQLESSVRSK